MSYASDKLYNGYLRRNMPRIVTTVKAIEIIVHLPCLTEHDMETIEAKKGNSGNFEAMMLLLNCLKRRESWPEQFIAALEECGHRTIAAEISTEYDKLRGINNSSPPPPAPPAANVVTAHVHPAPSAPHLPDPEPTASALPARDVSSETRVTTPIQETETPTQSTPVQPATPVVKVTTPPEPPQTQAVVVPPATDPPSPGLARDSTNPFPRLDQVDVIPRQQPEENLEPDIVQAQEVPNETDEMVNIPQEAEENTEVLFAAAPKEEPCDESMETTTMVDQTAPAPAIVANENTPLIDIVNKPDVAEPEPVIVTMEDPTLPSMSTVEEDAFTTTFLDKPIAPPVAVEVSPVRSASPLTNLTDLILTPEKPPVQETIPREEKIPTVVPALEETPKPQNAQAFEIVQEIEVTLSPPVEVENGESDQGLVSEEDILFSKPGVLISVEPPDQNNTTMRPPSPDPVPYSGDSGRLEMSEAEKSAPSCQENGISHMQLDKEVSESPAPSLEEEDVEENVGEVAEEPSILNKEIEASQTEDSGLPTKEIATTVPLVPASTLISDPSCCTNSGDMSESSAPSLEEEDVEENVGKFPEEPSILNKEIEAPQTEDSGAPTKEIATTVSLEPATALISDPSCCSNAGDMSESPAPSLDVEDVEENISHVVEQPSVLNQENQIGPEKQIIEITIPATTMISDISCCPDEEGVSESPAPSLDTEDVRENVGHIAEQPSILNLEMQTPIIQVNGEPAKEITPVPPKPAPATNDNHQPNDPRVDQKLPGSGNHTTNRLNTRYILAAAGVGACALLIAWRFKH